VACHAIALFFAGEMGFINPPRILRLVATAWHRAAVAVLGWYALFYIAAEVCSGVETMASAQ